MAETNSEILNIEIRADGLDDLQRISRELTKLGITADTSSKKIRDASSQYNRAAKSTKAFESELQRLVIRAAEVPKRIDFINQELRELAAAGDTGSEKVQALQQQLRRLTDEQNKMAAANQGAVKSFRNVRGVVQNTAFQLTDFIVSLQNGQKATVAFTQQAPQLLGALGPWGAVAGLAASGLGALATVLLTTKDATEEAEEEVDQLAEALERADTAIGKFNSSLKPSNGYLEDLRENLSGVTIAAKVTALRIETITLDGARRDVQTSGRAILKELETIGQTAGLEFSRAFNEYEGALQTANNFAEQEEAINALIFSLSRLPGGYREQIDVLAAYKVQLSAVAEQEQALVDARTTPKETVDNTAALKAQIKAYEDYQRALASVLRQADPLLAAQQDLAEQFALLDRAIKEAGGASSTTAKQFVEARRQLQAIFDKKFNAEIQVELYNPTEDVLVDAWLKDINEVEEATVSFTETLQNNVKDAAISAGDALIDFAITGEQAFGDMITSMLADLAKLALRMQLTQAFGNSGFFGGGGGAVTPQTETLGIRSLTAGPRSVDSIATITPLTRSAGSGGGLAPAANGGATTVNVINNSGGTAEVRESQNSDGTREITVMIESAMENAVANGRMDKVLGANYGLRRQGY